MARSKADAASSLADIAGGAANAAGAGSGKGGGGGIRADAGYGSVVDAGAVLVTLTPNAELIVFAPSGTELKQLATYKVGEPGVYAYPVLSGNRIFIKDKNSVALWTVE